MRSMSVVIVLIALSGCASLAPMAKKITLTSRFSAEEVAWFNATGTSSLTGQAFFQTRGGQPRTCAGLEIELKPKSSYGDERLTAIYGNPAGGYTPAFAANIQFTPDDAKYKEMRRTTVCDAQGNFSFTDLPAGDYFVTSSIIWILPGQEFAPPQGGVLMKSVNLGDGQTKRILLTPPP